MDSAAAPSETGVVADEAAERRESLASPKGSPLLPP